MAEHLRVDPVDVRFAGEQVDAHAGDFATGHAAAHERIAAAQSGFVGDSAAALAELTAHWQEETARHHRELCGHADNLRTAGVEYETTDTDAATKLDAAASRVAKRMGI